MTNWYIGTMGFGYRDWQGTFYPDKLPKACLLYTSPARRS